MKMSGLCLFAVLHVSVMQAVSLSDIREGIRQGQLLQSEGRFPEAQQRLKSITDSALQLPAPSDVRVTALLNLASVEIDLCRMSDAARLSHAALQVLVEDANPDPDRIRKVQVQIAELYLEADEIEIAHRLLRPLAAELQQEPSTRTPGSAYALDVLASIYSRQKRFALAERTERRSLNILTDFEDSDAAVAIGMLHLSTFLNFRRKPAEALPYARRALEMLSALALPQPAMQASARINLASIYSRIERPAEARREGESALSIVTVYYGAEHPKTGLMFLAEAAVLRAIGDRRAARASQARGEEILHSAGLIPLGATVPVTALRP